MSNIGFTLNALRVRGKGVPDAIIHFDSRLTIIAGLSNTGKSYVYHCVKYMLGSKTRPKDVSEAKAYNRVQLELETRDQRKFVLERGLSKAGDFKLYKAALHDLSDSAEGALLSGTHSQNNPANISSFLLRLSGFREDYRLLEKKTTNETRPLWFHDLRPFFLVDEVRMISEGSPVHPSGQYTDDTAETATFDLMISGRDWSDLVAKPKKLEVRVATWEGQNEVLQELIAPLEESLKDSPPAADIAESRVLTEERIANAMKQLAEVGEQVKELNIKKKKCLDEKKPKELRIHVIEQLLRQFELLKQSYRSDLERLEFIEETANLTSQLGTENCPMCGQPLPELGHREHIYSSAEDQIQAARAERKKLAIHLADLANTMSGLEVEKLMLAEEIETLDGQIEELDIALKSIWRERSKPIEETLATENKILAQLSRQLEDWQQLEKLRARLHGLGDKPRRQRKGKNEDVAGPRIPTEERREFCNALESTLTTWKVPGAGTVEFDEKMNLIIDGVRASSNGKGVRAIITTAFVVTLMRYCVAKRLPHPGIVVLDSPLTSYKEEDREELGEEVQQAFYNDLAKDSASTQVVILENKEPPAKIQEIARYYHFTRNHDRGRYGFFPTTAQDIGA